MTVRRHCEHVRLSLARLALAVCLAWVGAATETGNAADDQIKTREVEVQDITLTVPDTWEQKPASGKLRLAQFEIPAAEGDEIAGELVISHFGVGGGGTVQANIDRWVGQFEAKGRTAKFTKGKSSQGEYILVDITGTYNNSVGPPFLKKTEPMPGARMLSVILAVQDKGNYFLKLTGPEKTVTASADALRTSIGAKAEDEEELKQDEAKEEK